MVRWALSQSWLIQKASGLLRQLRAIAESSLRLLWFGLVALAQELDLAR